MKNILIIADIYPPEVSSAAHLMQELAEGLHKRGHKVWVLTSYPNQYLPVAESQQRNLELLSEEHGIHVVRVQTLPLRKVNFLIRGISQLFLPFLFVRQAKKNITDKIDAIFVFSPPLSLAMAGHALKKYYKAKLIVHIGDMFPQNAIDLGILKWWKHFPIIKFFQLIENKAYKDADFVTVHSEGGKKYLVDKKGVPEEKIVFLPNWVDVALYQNEQTLSFRDRWGLGNKFIFLFAGVMGPAQGLEFIIDIARRVINTPDIMFLLVGDGMEKEKLEILVKNQNLSNILIKPFVAKDEYLNLVKEIDVGLVCLSPNNKTPFIPGKFTGYMAAGKPVVAFLHKESDGFGLVEGAQCGYATLSNDLEEAVNVVRRMCNERANLEQLGNNGLAYAKKYLSLEVCLETLEKLF